MQLSPNEFELRVATCNGPVMRRHVSRLFTSYLRTLEECWDVNLTGITVVLNRRLTRTIARCRPSACVVEISSAVLAAPPRRQREILCHEAAHAVVSQRFGRRARPHGPEWADLVRLAGHEPAPSLVRCDSGSEPKRARGRFRHLCPVCHFSKVADRRMPRWRCPECAAIGLPGVLAVERTR